MTEKTRQTGKARLSAFARKLLAEWRRLGLPSAGGRVLVAVSGGADSAALLLGCEELSKAGRLNLEVAAAHLDHGLRGAAGERDARWVEELARACGFACVKGRARVGERAESSRDNLEQAARRARYEFLADAARDLNARAVLTAHTLDDQAETVLLRLLRGSGAEGLGGIPPTRRLAAEGDATLARPLLRWARRADTEEYCRARGVEARVDEMNTDERFARVRVRRKLLPLVESFNPRAVEALGRAAELLREDAAALETEAARLLAVAGKSEIKTNAVKTDIKTGAVKSEVKTGGPAARVNSGEVIPNSKESNAAPGEVNTLGADGATVEDDGPPPPLRVRVLADAPVALRRRALRQWVGRGRGDLRRVELAHVEAVERLLEGERGGRVAQLPGGSLVERRRGWLLFHASRDR